MPRGRILRTGEGLLTFLEEAATVQRTPCVALQHHKCSGFAVLLDPEQVFVMSRPDRPAFSWTASERTGKVLLNITAIA